MFANFTHDVTAGLSQALQVDRGEHKWNYALLREELCRSNMLMCDNLETVSHDMQAISVEKICW
jgi:hypothetical protein